MKKIPYEKSLEYRNPELAKEWHPTKNGDLKPSEVSAYSNKKVWWYLIYDDPKTNKRFEFEWEASIMGRNQRNGCPYLSGRKIYVGFNDLFSTNPECRERWNFELNIINPYEVTKSSSKVAWWKCEYGHSWEQPIQSIIRHKSKCPICTGRKLIVGVNDLATVRKDLVPQWNQEKNEYPPEHYKACSKQKVWWICEKGHEWEAIIASRALNNNGCPYCSGHYPIEGENDLRTVYPNIAKEWHYGKNELPPERYKPFSNQKVWWICEKGHEWEARIAKRTLTGSKCPYCSGYKVTEENSIKTLYPELMKEWDYDKNQDIRPEECSAGSEKKVHWICEKGHEWMATISNRTKCHSGCPYCCGNLAIPGVTDIKTKCPELIEELHPTRNKNINLETITFRSHQKLWWICKMGHEWRASPHNRACGDGCPVCRRNR